MKGSLRTSDYSVEKRPAADSIPPGEMVADKYRIDRVIGVGGVGIVYAATHSELDAPVAIKFLRPEMQARPDIVRRFGREAKAAVRLKSEHVARVYDVGVMPGHGPYMAMEYLGGKDLAKVLAAEGPLPIKRAVEYILQVCE